MIVFSKVDEISLFLDEKRSKGAKIGFVPTMGALHPGHVSLIQISKSENEITVCSIFVNPTQFTDQSDLEKYPRTLESDKIILNEALCDVLFVPEVKEMYPFGDPMKKEDYNFGELENVMEGKFRPGHFKGVALVVDKLFRIINPTSAYFGEKDFQQLAIIRQMSRERYSSIDIIGCETIREKDGLAMSSRNTLLSSVERKEAVLISEAMHKMKREKNELSVDDLKKTAYEFLAKSEYIKPEYIEIVNFSDLKPITHWEENSQARVCIAARVGNVRLIDNMFI